MMSASYFKLKLRYIRHPYLIWRAIIGHYERRFSKCVRVNEYRNYIIPVERGLLILLGANESLIKNLKAQLMGIGNFKRK